MMKRIIWVLLGFFFPLIDESDEGDNEYTKTITIQSLCSYSISPMSNSFTGAAGTDSVNGTVKYFVLANNTGSAWTGTLTIAGETFTISQESN
jgi:hypothetical protein